MKQLISNSVTSIFHHLEDILINGLHYHIKHLETVTTYNEKLGQLSMTVNEIVADDILQGRLSVFLIGEMIIGMMFYQLPQIDTSNLLIGTDIMISGYAMSLVCLEINGFIREFDPYEKYLTRIKEDLTKHSVIRKTPSNFFNVFHPNHLIFTVKKNHEKNVSDIIKSHHYKAASQLMPSASLQ